MKCPDCKGAGSVLLLVSKSPCKTCGGVGLMAPPGTNIGEALTDLIEGNVTQASTNGVSGYETDDLAKDSAKSFVSVATLKFNTKAKWKFAPDPTRSFYVGAPRVDFNGQAKETPP